MQRVRHRSGIKDSAPKLGQEGESNRYEYGLKNGWRRKWDTLDRGSSCHNGNLHRIGVLNEGDRTVPILRLCLKGRWFGRMPVRVIDVMRWGKRGDSAASAEICQKRDERWDHRGVLHLQYSCQ